MLQESGLGAGACPESVNLGHPEIVTEIHRKYAEAGADILTTNTFGGSRIKLSEYGLGDRVAEVSRAAVKAARETVNPPLPPFVKGGSGGFSSRNIYIAGDMGPTGKFLEPVGELSFDAAYANFYEQAEALSDAGADLLLIETMSDLKEARCAVIAAKAASKLPVAVTMTFQKDLRTLLGTPPDVAVAVLEAAGADIVGANCSLGPEGLYEVAKLMSCYASVPLIFQPNAGLPKLIDGKTVYPASPEELGQWAEKFLGLGVRLIGSCCGSNPAHTKAIAEAVRKKSDGSVTARSRSTGGTRLASRTKLVSVGAFFMPAVIGERINPTGRKALSEELSKGVFNIVKREAREQTQAGAALIDINVGLPGADEAALMPRVVRAAQESTDLPLVIDSTDPKAIEAALKEVGGKCLVNSVTGDKERLESILPLVKKYGAAVVGLTIDDNGIPQTAEARLEIAQKILDACLAHGIPKEDLVIDCLVMTASAEQAQGMETLRAVSLIKEKLGLATSLGISNVSFGLPERPLINATYLAMALGHGLDAAMVNIYDERIRGAMSAGAVLTGRDKRAERYVASMKKVAAIKEEDKLMKELDKFIEEGEPFIYPIDLKDVKEQLKLEQGTQEGNSTLYYDHRTFYIKIPPSDFYNQVNDALGRNVMYPQFDSLNYEMTTGGEAGHHDYVGKIKITEVEKTINEKQQKVEFAIFVPDVLSWDKSNSDIFVKVEIEGETPLEKLRNLVISGNVDEIVPVVEFALNIGFDPMSISNNCMIPALEEVGKLYEKGEIFLPQVMQSAEAMKAAFARLKKEMKGQGKSAGKVLLATVYGDVHDIGKNILATLLENHGLEVIDLGKNVKTETILDEAEKQKPDVIGLSALMTTTMTQMGAVIKERDRRGLKIPVVLGGAVVTEGYAQSVGAAAFSRDAMEAVEIFKRIIREGRS